MEFVVPRVASAIVEAAQRLEPAKIGWTSVESPEFTNCRRWITRSDRQGTDPFGKPTVRAMMHPGYLNPNYVHPAGPIDPELSVLSIVAAKDQTPICVLANYSMHYFGNGAGFSADYFGEVAAMLEATISMESVRDHGDFVGIMSQGTSGDLHWMDYAAPQRSVNRSQYARGISDRIVTAWKQIEYREDCSLAMAEKRIRLRRRTPDAERLAWAAPLNQQRGDRPPRNQQEVYAQQAQWINDHPETDVVLQAVRIGELGITALPNEVYGITGLKLKLQSPLPATFNLELANGAEGYIPPPEQHRLGGYTTWPARTAGLEVEAEPKIVDAVLSLLETVSGKPRREPSEPLSDYAKAVLRQEPLAYWRLDDLTIHQAKDLLGSHPADYRGGVALYLDGSNAKGMQADEKPGRSVYFAGGSVGRRTGRPAGGPQPVALLLARLAGRSRWRTWKTLDARWRR